MSDRINHECGIALVRLLKPLEYYLAKYGTATYGMNKLHLLMQKQHNRRMEQGLPASNLILNPETNTSTACVPIPIPRSKIFFHPSMNRSNRLPKGIRSGFVM
jgi:hypothetical protein